MDAPDRWFTRHAPRLAAVLAALVLAAVAVGAVREDRRERAIGLEGRAVVLVLSPEHGREMTPERRAALAEILRRESGLRVEVRVAATSLDAIEAFGDGADAGLLTLFEYLLARRSYGVEAALQVLRAGGADYAGVVAVPADSPVADLAGLAGRRVAFADPYSTSGFVFPAKLLADAGVAVETLFVGGHPRALEAVREGRADAAATYEGAVAGDPAWRVLARTDSIPNEPVFFRPGLRSEKRARLAAALEALAADTEGAALLRLVADVTGFRPVGDAAYDGAAEAIRAAGSSVYEVVPEGLRIEARRRGIPAVP